MKTQATLLALCLLSAGLASAQTTTNSSSTTMTNSTSGTTPTTTNMNSTSPPTMSTGDSSTTGTGTVNSTGSMNSTGTVNNGSTTNSATSPTYGTATTTTTTTSSDNMTTGVNANADTRKNKDRPAGKDGKFGVYAGVNFSRFVNEPIPDGAYRAGYQVGVYGRSAGTVFGQLGLEYRASTSNLVRNGVGQTTQTVKEVRGQIDQYFVAIPAYVGVRIGSSLGLRLQAGAELSTLVRNPNNSFGIQNDDFRRTILGGLLGAGINLGPLTLDAVYNYGLQNVFEGADTKRRLLALNVGFRF